MRVLKVLAAVLLAGLVVLIGAFYFMSEPRPEGQPSPEADALARKMEQAVHKEAWDRTGAVQWSFFDEHHYVWDRTRDVVEVTWGGTRVLLRTHDQSGRAFDAEGELAEGEAAAAIRRAYEFWVNDSFWLNPVVKVFDPGVERAIVEDEDGERGLLVSYTSGGVTPGDAYLWFVDPDGLPVRWKMWVSIIPIGGISMTWESWVELDTGALISTEHEGGGQLITFITDLKGATDLEGLGVSPTMFDPLFRE